MRPTQRDELTLPHPDGYEQYLAHLACDFFTRAGC